MATYHIDPQIDEKFDENKFAQMTATQYVQKVITLAKEINTNPPEQNNQIDIFERSSESDRSSDFERDANTIKNERSSTSKQSGLSPFRRISKIEMKEDFKNRQRRSQMDFLQEIEQSSELSSNLDRESVPLKEIKEETPPQRRMSRHQRKSMMMSKPQEDLAQLLKMNEPQINYQNREIQKDFMPRNQEIVQKYKNFEEKPILQKIEQRENRFVEEKQKVDENLEKIQPQRYEQKSWQKQKSKISNDPEKEEIKTFALKNRIQNLKIQQEKAQILQNPEEKLKPKIVSEKAPILAKITPEKQKTPIINMAKIIKKANKIQPELENEEELQKFIFQKKNQISKMAHDIENQLNNFLPQANEAIIGLKNLTDSDVRKVMENTPSTETKLVVSALMILLEEKNPKNWQNSKYQMGRPDFLRRLLNFDRKNILPKTVQNLARLYRENMKNLGQITNFGKAESAFYKWVIFIEDYQTLKAETNPIQQQLKQETEELRKKGKVLELLQQSVKMVRRPKSQNRILSDFGSRIYINDIHTAGYQSPHSVATSTGNLKNRPKTKIDKSQVSMFDPSINEDMNMTPSVFVKRAKSACKITKCVPFKFQVYSPKFKNQNFDYKFFKPKTEKKRVASPGKNYPNLTSKIVAVNFGPEIQTSESQPKKSPETKKKKSVKKTKFIKKKISPAKPSQKFKIIQNPLQNVQKAPVPISEFQKPQNLTLKLVETRYHTTTESLGSKDESFRSEENSNDNAYENYIQQFGSCNPFNTVDYSAKSQSLQVGERRRSSPWAINPYLKDIENEQNIKIEENEDAVKIGVVLKQGETYIKSLIDKIQTD